MSIKRPPSYSDSYLYLAGAIPGDLTPIASTVFTTPLLLPLPIIPQEIRIGEDPLFTTVPPALTLPIAAPSHEKTWLDFVLVLGVKGCVHVCLISVFETVFFFLYVSKSENNGILQTLNTYYLPFLQACDGWSPVIRTDLLEFLEILGAANQTAVDAAARQAAAERASENLHLLFWCLAYTGICIGIGGACLGYLVWSKRRVEGREILGEHLFFVTVLGLYEWFFFRTIIYNYNTLSTPELNAYLMDGLYGCIVPPVST